MHLSLIQRAKFSKGEANTPSPYTYRHVQGGQRAMPPPIDGGEKMREEGKKKEEREGGERKGKTNNSLHFNKTATVLCESLLYFFFKNL